MKKAVEPWQLKQRQRLPLKIKEKLTKQRIKSWYDYWDGQVYVSFSGGKDSTVLLDIIRKMCPKVPAVFIDTGLEYPEIRSFVKTIDNVVWLRPKIPFHKIIKKYGYPVISKKQSRAIQDLQNPNDKNKATRNLRLTGLNRKGIFCPSQKLSKKWLYLVDSGVKISDKCCYFIKKEPFKKYIKETGRKPIIGTMAHESLMRTNTYLKQGCNYFNSKTNQISMPISFWVEHDIWEYIKKNNIAYSKIYDMGEKRTGCMFCMFGVHLEKGENRFQRMQHTHPKQWDYCINKLGCGKVMDLIKVNYKNTGQFTLLGE